MQSTFSYPSSDDHGDGGGCAGWCLCFQQRQFMIHQLCEMTTNLRLQWYSLGKKSQHIFVSPALQVGEHWSLSHLSAIILATSYFWAQCYLLKCKVEVEESRSEKQEEITNLLGVKSAYHGRKQLPELSLFSQFSLGRDVHWCNWALSANHVGSGCTDSIRYVLNGLQLTFFFPLPLSK